MSKNSNFFSKFKNFKKITSIFLASLLFFSSFNLQAATYNINVGETYTTLEALRLANVLGDGDTIVLHKDDKSTSVSTFNISNMKITLKSSFGAQMSISTGTIANRFFNISNGSLFNVENIKFEGGNSGANPGGAVNIENSTATFTNVVFANNKSTNNSGGAIRAYDNVSLNFANATFKNNEAVNYGGAIYAGTNVNVNFTGDALFENNISTNSGGAIYLDKSSATFNGTATFSNNKSGAGKSGGAILADNKSCLIFNSGVTFENNSSGYGALAILNGSTGVVKGAAEFKNNIGTNEGSAICVAYDNSLLIFENKVTFSSNTTNSGGALLVNAGTVIFNDKVQFLNNSSIASRSHVYIGRFYFFF